MQTAPATAKAITSQAYRGMAGARLLANRVGEARGRGDICGEDGCDSVAIPRDFAAEDGFASSDSPESCVGVDLPVSLRSDPLGADRRNPLESPRLSAG